LKTCRVAERLLGWWDLHGRKDLPWQTPRSAYRVWVAEIMLQQTQVKTVIPYFKRFTGRFEGIPGLAAASTDDVLALWSGLGYYARARNLLKTARICNAEHGGKLPVTPAELVALPGIGASTANAIYSQAWDQPAVVLDGNVKRVLARHAAVEGWPGQSSVHKTLWARAEKLLPSARGADYTQAVMDLGATVCTRTNPLCHRCPVSDDCRARLTGRVAQFPARRPKLKITNKTIQMLILTDKDGRVLLERRPPAGIWGGLWSLPADDAGRALGQRFAVVPDALKPLPDLHHQLTHMKLTIRPFMNTTEAVVKGVECGHQQRWFKPREWLELGLPKPVRQLLETHASDTHNG